MKRLLIILALITLPCQASNLYENNSYKIVIERAEFQKVQPVMPKNYFKYEKWYFADIKAHPYRFSLSVADTGLLMFGYRYGQIDKIQHRTATYICSKVTGKPLICLAGVSSKEVLDALGMGTASAKDIYLGNFLGYLHSKF